jgi:hypothetical protein
VQFVNYRKGKTERPYRRAGFTEHYHRPGAMFKQKQQIK